jgi:hypothetical protein
MDEHVETGGVGMSEWADEKAREWLERQHNRGVSPLPSRMETKHLLLRAMAEERKRVLRIVKEVAEQAKRDAAMVGPAVTGWACREIERRAKEGE